MSRTNAPRPASEHAAPTAGPFIKWAGGKGALLRQFDAHFPPRAQIRRYFEPFAGSAAVFFYLRRSKSVALRQV